MTKDGYLVLKQLTFLIPFPINSDVTNSYTSQKSEMGLNTNKNIV